MNQAKLEQALAEADKARADALKATVDASKAQREEAEASGALGQQQREAEAHKAIAEAKKSEFDAQQARVAALIPDLSKATVPELKVSGEQALFSSRVTHRALNNAAAALEQSVSPSLPAKGSGRVLLTTADDLASLDGVYVEVNQGLSMLREAADALLPPQPGIAPVAVAAAVAAALPGLISFFAPTRSVSSHTMTLDDPMVLAAVAGKLAGTREVMLADFRTVPQDGVVNRDNELMEKRGKLLDERAEVAKAKEEAEAKRATAQATLDAVLTKHEQDAEQAAAKQEIDNAAAARKRTAEALALKIRQAAQIDDVIKAIDGFRTAVHTVPPGGVRSPLVTAALYEAMHWNGTERFAAVLLVKSGGGSIDQLIDDRKLRKDRFDMIGTATIAYWVIDPQDSLVKASGTAAGSARLQGTIGERFNLTNE
jgi:hypothetical protein